MLESAACEFFLPMLILQVCKSMILRLFPPAKTLFFPVLLWTALLFSVPSLQAQCFLTEGLDEEQQRSFTRQMYDDGLFQEAWNAAACYLQEFKSGKWRQDMMYLQASASMKAGSLTQALRDLQNFQKSFPQSKKYRQQVLFHKGKLLAKTQQYTGALQTLKLLLREFPRTTFADESRYWIGFVTFYRAELIRQETSLEQALPEYQSAISHFLRADPDSLPGEAKQERLHLLGWCRLFQNKPSLAIKYWEPYLDQLGDQAEERALTLKHRLALGFQKNGEHDLSAEYYRRVHEEHPKSPLATSSAFWRAEMNYAALLAEAKKNKAKIPENKAKLVLVFFQKYLNTRDTQYKAVSHYRLGLLQQQVHNFSRSIAAYQDYLKTGDATYQTEVLYRLGTLFQEKKRNREAIQAFRNHLKGKKPGLIPDSHYRLGALYQETGNIKKAIASYEDYLKSGESRNAAAAHFQAASLYQRLDNLSGAEDHFAHASADYPEFAQRGAAAFWRAETAYTQAVRPLKKNPGYKIPDSVLEQLGSHYHFFLQLQMDADQASSAAEHVPLAHFRLGFIFQLRDQSKQAIAAYQNYLETGDKRHNAETLYRQGALYEKVTQPQNAIEAYNLYLKTGDKLYPGEVLFRLGMLYEQQEMLPEAIHAFERYVEQDPDSENAARLHYRIGNLRVKIQHPIQAIASLEKARNYNEFRNNILLLQSLELLYQETGQPGKQLSLLEQSRDNPALNSADRDRFRLRLAYLYYDRQKCDRVIRELRNLPRSLAAEEKNRLLYIRGSCYFNLKKWDPSRKDLVKIRDEQKYREAVIRMLLFAHQQLKDWKKLTEELQAAFQKQSPKLTSEDYALWVYAAHQRQDPKRTHTYYERWRQAYPDDFLDLERLLDWAKLTEQLGMHQESVQLYETMLQLLVNKQLETREFVVLKLAELYQQGESPENLVPLYEKEMMPLLAQDKQNKDRYRNFAFFLGNFCKDEIKDQDCAKKWLRKTDGGGTHEEELQARLTLSEMAEQDNRLEDSIQWLSPLKERPLSNRWRIIIHFRAAALHQQLRQWGPARKEFKLVASLPRQEDPVLAKMQTSAEEQLKQINQFLSSSRLQELVEEENWPAVSEQIRSEVEEGTRSLDQENFNLLLSAERNQKNWSGILRSYRLLSLYDQKTGKTVSALLVQADAAEKLKNPQGARNFYEEALRTIPLNTEEKNKQVEVRRFLSEDDLQKKFRNKDWAGISQQLREEVKQGYRKLDNQSMELLVSAEIQQKNWSGILSAYNLLSRSDPKAGKTVSALLVKADAAENLGNPRQARKFYEEALQAIPHDTEEEKKQAEVRRFLSEDDLQNKIRKQDWAGISKQIRDEVQRGYRKLDSQSMELLVSAETRRENWSGVLSAYSLLKKTDPELAETQQALLLQAQASEKLDRLEEAKKFYRKILSTAAETEAEREQQEEVRKYLSQQTLQENLSREDWSAVSAQLRREVRRGERMLDEQTFELLVSVESRSENWPGVLSAYELLKESDPQRVRTVSSLLIQAKAAEKLDDPVSARKFYEQLLQAVPQNQEEKTRQDGVRRFLSEDTLQKKIAAQDWPGISEMIRLEVQAGQRVLDEQNFNLLLSAESRRENWSGILSAYSLLEKYDKDRARTVDALLEQAKASESLGNSALAARHYRLLLEAEPRNESERTRQKEVQRFLNRENLRKNIEGQNWPAVSRQIREQVASEEIVLDEAHFQWLLNAETQQQNWAGVLSAYELLNRVDANRTNTVPALIHQAQVADAMGNNVLSRTFFQQVLKAHPRDIEEEKQQEEVRRFLSQESLQGLIKNKDWNAVTEQIRKEVKSGKRELDISNFELMLYAEKQKKGRKKWEGILNAYALMAKHQKSHTVTIKALIEQGEAAEKLGGRRRAKGYYQNALKKIPAKNLDRLLFVVTQLERLYQREKNYQNLVRVYETAYNALKKNTKKEKETRYYAFQIGFHRLTHLKQKKAARKWLMRADGGGVGKTELQAVYWITQLDRQGGNIKTALKRMKEVSKRKIPETSPWYVVIHYELGTLYHLQESWEPALQHYRLAAKIKPPKGMEEYHRTALQRADEIDAYLQSLKSNQ